MLLQGAVLPVPIIVSTIMALTTALCKNGEREKTSRVKSKAPEMRTVANAPTENRRVLRFQAYLSECTGELIVATKRNAARDLRFTPC